MSGALVLFTRDLRVADQAPLAAAARESDFVVPAFVLDSELLSSSCAAPNRLSFLLDSLGDLDRSLAARGARLQVRRGELVAQAMRLVHEWDLSAIYMSADHTPYAKRRHARLSAACQRARVRLCTFPGITVVEPGELTPTGGDHYRVFTPYWRVWRELARGAPARAPRRIAAPPRLPAAGIPSLASLTRKPVSPALAPGGESVAREHVKHWLRHGLVDYERRHDDLAGQATSMLSPHLHFGCLSVRELLARSNDRPGGEAFARQLCWRDFHHQVLAARPDLPHADYRPRGDRWHRDSRELDAWRLGLTGYPIVDAGMRQLASHGFMHNRARLIVGSFLTKLLYHDWRAGAAHFAALLLDADVANNVGNWQWVAGTGNDTRPNRVLNPLRQAQRFDPSGQYVRRHVPELADVPGRAVHEPWRLSAAQRRSIAYPERLIDHTAAASASRHRR